jgi:hypothetical protein
MTPDMKTFLIELADLLEKHGAEVEVIEKCAGYYTYCTGIEFTMVKSYSGDNRLWVNESVKTSLCPDVKELRKIAEEGK